MKHLCTTVFLSFTAATAFSQAAFLWANRMGGAESDAGWAITSDNSGNIYSTGFFNGTVDFDPGPGILNLTSNGQEDIFICKNDPAGNFLWAKSIGGINGDRGFAIATDPSGNVYVTGAFVGTADFDPGTGTFNLTSGSTYGDMYIVKLDPSGNLSWAKQFGGSGGIAGYSIAVGSSGEVYGTGSFTDTVDFDPGAAVFNMISTGSYDIFVCKIDAAGNFIWAKQMGGTTGTEDNVSNAIALDAAGNVYTTGAYEDVTDFDPGPGFYPLDTTGFFVSKLDAAGNFIWAKNIVSQNVLGNAMTVDANNDLIIAGSFSYSADFDTGPGSFVQDAGATKDAFILKMSAAGNFIWMKELGSPTGGDYAYSVRTDALGNIYSAGSFQDVADMDPGAATFDLTTNGMDDIFISKLDASGNFICASAVGGTDVDYAYGLTLDQSSNIYITGAFMNAADFDPGPGTAMHTSAGLEDIFLSAISDCTFTTNIDESKAGELSLFPNPAAENVFIGGLQPESVLELYSSTGEKLHAVINRNVIDTSTLCKGIYLVKITDGKQTRCLKFIRS
ncbi:MAG: SBBP repeat-containing protein [Bacteroidia bacterium]